MPKIVPPPDPTAKEEPGAQIARWLGPVGGGFVLLLHILPIIGIVFVMFRNEMALWYVLPLCMAFVTGLCRFAAVYAGKRIGTMNSLQNLRRDY